MMSNCSHSGTEMVYTDAYAGPSCVDYVTIPGGEFDHNTDVKVQTDRFCGTYFPRIVTCK